MLKTAVRSSLATIFTFAGLLLLPSAAHACSCVSAAEGFFVRHADAVFVGTVLDRDVDHPSWPMMSSGDPVTYRVEVHQVYQGQVGPVVAVDSAASGASCGVDMAVGRRYVVYASTSGGGDLQADLCGGTSPVGVGPVASLSRLLGDPAPPDASIPVPEDNRATMAWGVGGAGLASVALVALMRSGLALRSRRTSR